jgi:5'-nucleotidase
VCRSEGAELRVLLTNDDGYQAEGIAAIRAGLISAGAQVTTVAPQNNCSGFARACTFSRPVSVHRAEAGPNPIYYADGTPTDCVRVGILGHLAEDVDLVVSGINHGANLADDITYSGTVGAGLEAAILGISAVCLSQQTPTGSFSVNYSEDLESLDLAYDFALAVHHGTALAFELAATVPTGPVVLSVNYPNTPDRGIAWFTRPGTRSYPIAAARGWGADETHRDMYLFGEPDQDIPESNDTYSDIAALRAGRISISALSYAFGVTDLPQGLRTCLDDLSTGLRDRHSYMIESERTLP